jgi:Ca2+-binding RTX toxin-like protein
MGTDFKDTLNGAAKAETIIGAQGHDTINGGGGADSINGGSGNDQIHVSDNKFFRIDGGSGTDTFHLDFGGTIDLGNLDNNAATSDRGRISGIEVIDIANGQSNALVAHLADILDLEVRNANVGGKAALDNVLLIEGDAGDTLQLSTADGWGASPDTASLAGYAIYKVNLVRVAVDTDISVTLA